MKRVAVFGATGAAGRPLVEQALAEGLEVTALVRDPARVAARHERLRVVQGDAADPRPSRAPSRDRRR